MAHPFEKIFEKAIMKSRGDENHVLGEAERLMEAGYPPAEIHEVLVRLRKGRVLEAEEAILTEAAEEFGRHLDTDDL